MVMTTAVLSAASVAGGGGNGAGDSGSILVVEDDLGVADSLQYSLAREGYTVTVATNGRQGLDEFRAGGFELVVLDLMLPLMSGLDLCRMIRAHSTVPIVILSAKDSEADKVVCFEMGADDYVTKPFSIRELTARIRARLRRQEPAPPVAAARKDMLVSGAIELDTAHHEVRVAGRTVELRRKEFALLKTLLEARGRLCTRTFLIGEVWGHDYYGDTKTLDVHVKRLRQKIERDPHHPRQLVTVRGLGYRLLDAVSG
jgi:two-component system, OmpR family, response regulator RegX3